MPKTLQIHLSQLSEHFKDQGAKQVHRVSILGWRCESEKIKLPSACWNPGANVTAFLPCSLLRAFLLVQGLTKFIGKSLGTYPFCPNGLLHYLLFFFAICKGVFSWFYESLKNRGKLYAAASWWAVTLHSFSWGDTPGIHGKVDLSDWISKLFLGGYPGHPWGGGPVRLNQQRLV